TPALAPLPNGQGLVAYLDSAGAKAVVVTASTTAVGTAKQVSLAETPQRCEAIAGEQVGPRQYLIVWTENRAGTGSNIYGQRLDASGQRVGFTFAISEAPGDQTCPRLSAGSLGWLVVWTDDRNASSTGTDIYGATVSSSSQVAPV